MYKVAPKITTSYYQTYYKLPLSMTGPCQMLPEMVLEAFKRLVAKEI